MVLIGSCLVAEPAHASPGDLDQAFATGGVLEAASTAIAVQPDAKTLILEGAQTASDRSIEVRRVTAEGEPDRSFSEDGLASFEPLGDGEGTAFAHNIALTTDAEIVISGSVGPPGGSRLMVARLLPDGSPDQSFGSGGISVIDRPPGYPSALAIDSSHRVVAGVRDALVRLTRDGRLDTGFSSDGIQEIGDAVDDVALGPDDSIFALTYTGLHKLDSAGEPDQSFGDGGLAEFSGGGEASVALDGAGRVIAGSRQCTITFGPSAGSCSSSVRRLTPSGALDQSYGENGITSGAGGLVAVDDEDRVLVGSASSPRRGVGLALAISRLNAAGELDAGFGSRSGAFAVGAGAGRPIDLEVGPDGKITAASRTAVARFEVADEPGDADADGQLDGPDRCDFLSATTQTGCPRIERPGELRQIGRTYLVPVIEPRHPGCIWRQVVKLWRVKRGGPLLVERRETSTNGRTPLFFGLPRGRYYATVGADFKPGIGFCERTRTPSITLSRNLDPAPDGVRRALGDIDLAQQGRCHPAGGGCSAAPGS